MVSKAITPADTGELDFDRDSKASRRSRPTSREDRVVGDTRVPRRLPRHVRGLCPRPKDG